ncbi:YheC/YheD family protein [Aneurinibacillus sp. Ricciae_BoGa-3]|uniref:YheC/YheD family protein n=1 Tax=Aneurinibacillus sp. Ricciae_BoGa-3 TaxID=3022697 RepID=UPI002342463C|nr:YheC/YheD family protein [Aneurinibacillus sp. Ricciae_BoGa-3]WCK52502.1 YheC/YheD family protein [Aneurinibacillus sp. Ricciae_BoGa-3]
MIDKTMNKLEKFNVLKEDKRVNSFVPETRFMAEEHLWELLKKYGAVILKPIEGSGGRGIITVSSEANENEAFRVQVKLIKQVVTSKDLYSYLTREILGDFVSYFSRGRVSQILSETYIVQHQIPLAEIDNRPFDIRVMVQRKNDSPWKVTGKLAKLASLGYALTNINLGATILAIQTALQRSSLKHLSPESILSQLDQLALWAADQLHRQDPNIKVIGFDMCLDTNGKVWILEANFTPHAYIFLELEDKTMYETIQEYK